MRPLSVPSMLLAVVLVVAGAPAQAQYHYPGGYGGYGWGGWGGAGSTVGGSRAAGMGMYAAGAGSYNVQTAQARSMNANTAMQWNDYAYQCQQRNSANEMARLQKRQKATVDSLDATYKRLHDNPNAHDIHAGDAENVVLTELVNPSVLNQVAQDATPIDSQLVKNINFQYAPNMILISLDDLSARGVPDYLATDPDFASDRQAIRALIAKGKREAESSNEVSIDTIRSFRAAVTAAKDKADAKFQQGTRQRDEVDNLLKALIGLSKMLERPNVEQFLKGLNRYPATTMGHLVTFMHSFNLKFGAAKTPDQEAVYDQLYPMLVALRDQLQARGPNPLTAAQAPLPDTKQATSFFSGMDYSHFQPQPDPHTGAGAPPPGPGQSR
jgi:hypothetical protein